MISHEGLFVARGRLHSFGLVLLVAVLVSAGPSTAADRFVVTRDGKKVRVIKAEDELAVTYRSFEDVAASARRLAADGTGVVVDVRGASRAKTKLLRVADTSARRRSLVARDPAIVDVRPVYRYDGGDTPLISTGTINVKLRRGLSEADRQQLWTDYRVQVIEPIEGLRRVYLVRPVGDAADEVLRAEVLADDHRTEWAEPNFRVPTALRQTIPLDAHYSRQWHLNNTGQSGGKGGADIDAPGAWLLADGQDILVGMFDDACDVDHEDLRGGYIGVGHDPSLQTTSPGFSDPRPKAPGDKHGTAVMGLAVARRNTVGVRGVAYQSRFTASRGLGLNLTNAQKASAFTFARQQEVDVHIDSWGIPGDTLVPAVLEEAIEAAFQDGRDLDGPEGDGTTNRPPRGMVVVFASGNGGDDGIGDEREAGREMATLPTVIGVGATDDSDLIATYSDYGPEIDLLAPGGDDLAALTTTDNDDNAGYIEAGYNEGGLYEAIPGDEDFESTGLYTGRFAGTSAACPVAGGVAALVLSANPQLTATSVRLIMEHTAEQVSPEDALYDGVTSRSLRYGYGRINARAAVEAAVDSLATAGQTWPERVANVRVDNGRLYWRQNGDPLEFLEEDAAEGGEGDDTGPEIQNDFLRSTEVFIVFESTNPFEFIPEDGVCYDHQQIACSNTVPGKLPPGVSVSERNGVKAIGCGLACGPETSTCEAGAEQCIEFDATTGARYFAIFAHSSIGRYSFGVKVDSSGNTVDVGRLPPGVALGVDDGVAPAEAPKVSISVSPLEGTSPLTVNFSGNAVSTLPIEETLTAWDFDIDDTSPVDSRQRTVQHTYEAPAGEVRTFIARLTMYDTAGNSGSAQVAIQVVGPATGGGGDAGDSGGVQIFIGVPGTVGSDLDVGVSPFTVELSLDTTSLTGAMQSVLWDLGDGSTAKSLFVTHTYVNVTDDPLRLPITATITLLTSGGVTTTATASRRITVLPGEAIEDQPDIVLPGTEPLGPGGPAVACGVLGLLPFAIGIVSLTGMRLRRWRRG